jgi:hypothetical protein
MPTWLLRPDLSIGGEESGPRSFGDVRGVVANSRGDIIVLEYQTQEIRLFDSKGTFVRLLARKGSGPAEIRSATGLAIGPDDVVWAHDPGNRRYARFFPDGHSEFILFQIRSSSYVWGAVVDSNGTLFEPYVVVVGKRINPETGQPRTENRLRVVELNGTSRIMDTPGCGEPDRTPAQQRIRITTPNGTLKNYAIPFLSEKMIALTARQKLWCTPADEYVLEYGTPDSMKEVFRKPLERVLVTDAERKRELQRFDSLQRIFGPITSGSPESIPRFKPAIDQLFSDDAGRAWVRVFGTSEQSPEFDVIDSRGRQVATAKVGGKVGPFVFVRGRYLYTVIRDDDDVPSIVRYAISERGK